MLKFEAREYGDASMSGVTNASLNTPTIVLFFSHNFESNEPIGLKFFMPEYLIRGGGNFLSHKSDL